MYKVITHTIKEEHFTHPVTVNHALAMKDANVYPIIGSSISSKKTPTEMSIRDTFRLNIKDLTEKYVHAVRNAIVSIFNSSEDLPVLEEEIKKSINDLKEGIKVVYGQTTDASSIALFGQHLTEYTNNLIDIAKAHKANVPTLELETKLMQKNDSFSEFLFQFNTKDWTKSGLYNYLSQFADAVKSQIVARKTKKWVEDQQYVKDAYNIFVVGIPGTLVSFAQYLADGILVQFPWITPFNSIK